MKQYIISLFLLAGIVTKAQNSIIELAEGYNYELSIPLPGDTVLHIPYVDLPTQMQLGTPHRVIEDERGISRFYYWNGWRIAYHVHNGQRSATTISRLEE